MNSSASIRCQELASTDLISSIEKKGRTIVTAAEGTEERRLLDYFNAQPNVGGEKLTHIILLPDARKVEAIEEFLHGTQFRLGIVQRRGVFQSEVHVKRFMIKHARLLRISDSDLEILRRMLP